MKRTFIPVTRDEMNRGDEMEYVDACSWLDEKEPQFADRGFDVQVLWVWAAAEEEVCAVRHRQLSDTEIDAAIDEAGQRRHLVQLPQ